MRIHIEITIPGFPWSIEDLMGEQHDAHVRAYERHTQLNAVDESHTNQTTLEDYYQEIDTTRKGTPHVKHAACCGAPRRCQKADGFCFDCRPDWAKTSDEDSRRRKSDEMNANYHGKR